MSTPNTRDHNHVTRYTEWINGVPVPRYAPIYTKKSREQLRAASWSNPYELKIDPMTQQPYESELKYQGMTCIEVAYARRAQAAAEGDLESEKMIDDRVDGRAKQTIDQNIDVQVTLQSFAKEVVQYEATGNFDIEYIPPDHLISQGFANAETDNTIRVPNPQHYVPEQKPQFRPVDPAAGV